MQEEIINTLLQEFSDIRYVAIYIDKTLVSKQRQAINDASSSDSDRYEELFVNPGILTLARQRGDIDCGGLKFVLIGYGNFYQLIKEVDGGHISVCLDEHCDLNTVPEKIISFIKNTYSSL